jgi:hypothetical protein
MLLVYRLPDGSELEAGRTFGWCECCNDIRDIEALMDSQQIRAELEAARKQARSPSRFILSVVDRVLGGGTDELKKEIENLEKRLRLAELRHSGPRCLTCGNDDTKPLSFDDNRLSLNLTHECGGRFRREEDDPDAVRFSYRLETIFLDEEGRQIDP